MSRWLSVLRQLVTSLVRPPPVRRSKPRHWYPKHWNPENPHTCYYCGRYDQEEAEFTSPPCAGKRSILL